ncbi:hypothetical protein ACWDRR_18945 [Kitasatospora sp. NPDC003701]
MDLHDLAEDLAARLPGAWTTEHHAPSAPEQAAALADRLCGPFIPHRNLDRAAVLSEPGRPLGLLATEYSTRSGRFAKIDTIAVSLGNLELDFYQDTPVLGTTAPLSGSTTSPFERARTAHFITRRLLPIHENLLDLARSDLLERSLRAAHLATDQWDAVSDSLCDDQGFPLDDRAYSAGLVRRDAVVFAHLAEVLPHSEALLLAARTRLAAPVDDRTRWSVKEFGQSLGDAAQILADWQAGQPNRVDAKGAPIEPGFTDALQQRNEEAWHPAHQWLTHGPAVLRLLRAPADGSGDQRAASATARSPALASITGPAEAAPHSDRDAGGSRTVRSR